MTTEGENMTSTSLLCFQTLSLMLTLSSGQTCEVDAVTAILYLKLVEKHGLLCQVGLAQIPSLLNYPLRTAWPWPLNTQVITTLKHQLCGALFPYTKQSINPGPRFCSRYQLGVL